MCSLYRLDTSACLVHPFFWTPARRLGFLADASDRFEIMERDPPEKGLVALETGAYDVVGIDWQRRLDKIFLDNLGKFRKYNGKSVQDLLRALRNKVSGFNSQNDLFLPTDSSFVTRNITTKTSRTT